VVFVEFKKAPVELVEFIAEKVKNVNCKYRQMFGYPSYFINGNMFAGLFGDKLLLRLSDADLVEILKIHPDAKVFEPMPGRAMKGYVALPRSVYSNDAAFEKLLNKSIEYVSSLPPKKTKAKK
jgi:TfoX/Sxy family transcriptional regulator of competence genes